MEIKNMKQEISEAIRAGERALSSLRAAQDKLGSARNWGIFDMLGGGFITDMVKHSKLNDAAHYIESAKHDILIFQREIRDVSTYLELKLDIGDFLAFADFFFDGIIADYLVQSKIAEASRQVDEAIRMTQSLLSELKRMHEYD